METRGNSGVAPWQGRRQERWLGTAVACVLLTLLNACGASDGHPNKAFHVVLVSLGQADAAGDPALPNLEQFKKTSTSLPFAGNPGAPPLQITASMLTGLTAAEHGAGAGPELGSSLAPEQTPLAEYLIDHGYNTSAVFASDCNMPPESGLAQGFGDYQAIPGNATDLAVLAEDWVEHHYRQPFFLFVHMPVTEKEGEAAREDEALGSLLQSLAARNLLDASLVVIKKPGHPLLIKAPGQRTARTDPRTVSDHHLPQLVLEHMALPVAAVRPNSYFTHTLDPLPTPAPE